jgi:hypothetical protein
MTDEEIEISLLGDERRQKMARLALMGWTFSFKQGFIPMWMMTCPEGLKYHAELLRNGLDWAREEGPDGLST